MDRKSILFRFALMTALLTGLFFVPSAVRSMAAGSWYVSTSGDDANSCSSPAAPCATIQAAIDKASPGDTVKVASSVYTGSGAQVVLVDRDISLSGGVGGRFLRPGRLLYDRQ